MPKPLGSRFIYLTDIPPFPDFLKKEITFKMAYLKGEKQATKTVTKHTTYSFENTNATSPGNKTNYTRSR